MTTTAAPRAAARGAKARAIHSDALITLGKAGWIAKGVIYALIGVLALRVVFSGGGDQSPGGGSGQGAASKDGALSEIASSSWGTWLLWILVIGLVGYALWRFLTAVLPAEDASESTAKVWGHRAAFLGSGIGYLLMAWTAGSLAASGSDSAAQSGGGGGGSEEAMVEKLSRTLIEQGWGRWVLALAGLGILVYAGYQVRKGVGRGFEEEVDLAEAGPTGRSIIDKSGVAGHIGRGIVAALISVFLVRAAWTANPEEANGLDATLREVADHGLGAVLVLVAAVGLLAYAVYCVASARHRVLTGP